MRLLCAGVFLACWFPFFTLNIINAVCIRYGVHAGPVCNVHPALFSLLVWLGYINSFLNPVIYTVFNAEFRRAFRRLLTPAAHRRGGRGQLAGGQGDRRRRGGRGQLAGGRQDRRRRCARHSATVDV